LCASLGTFFCYASAASWLGGPWWRRIARYPLFLAISVGISAHNTVAAIEAIFGKRSPFERTPKYQVTAGATSTSRRYRSRVSWSLAFDVLLTLCTATALGLAIRLRQYGMLPFLTLFTSGYGLVCLYSVSHLVRREPRAATATPELPGTERTPANGIPTYS
jgi:hypothetical protein